MISSVRFPPITDVDEVFISSAYLVVTVGFEVFRE